MRQRPRFLSALAAFLLITACSAPPGVSTSAPPTSTAATSEPAATPTATPPDAPRVRAVRIQATAGEQVLAGSKVAIVRAMDLSPVAEGLVLDDAGGITWDIDERLAAGTVLLVTATSDTRVLSGLFVVPEARAVSAIASDTDWQLDLMSSAIARKLTSKVADALRSAPPGPLSSGMRELLGRVDDLVARAREALRVGLDDPTTAETARRALQNATLAQLDDMANHLVYASTLKNTFVDVVNACNLQAIANMKAGGPLVVPSVWRVQNVMVLPPTLLAGGEQWVTITYNGQSTTIERPGASTELIEAAKHVTDTRTDIGFAAVNTSYVPGSSGGGSGHASAPKLQGTVKVGTAVQAGALVQLDDMNGNLVAKTATGANGVYQFYDVPNGTYQLTVAVDGAVQSTQIVTIGP